MERLEIRAVREIGDGMATINHIMSHFWYSCFFHTDFLGSSIRIPFSHWQKIPKSNIKIPIAGNCYGEGWFEICHFQFIWVWYGKRKDENCKTRVMLFIEANATKTEWRSSCFAILKYFAKQGFRSAGHLLCPNNLLTIAKCALWISNGSSFI